MATECISLLYQDRQLLIDRLNIRDMIDGSRVTSTTRVIVDTGAKRNFIPFSAALDILPFGVIEIEKAISDILVSYSWTEKMHMPVRGNNGEIYRFSLGIAVTPEYTGPPIREVMAKTHTKEWKFKLENTRGIILGLISELKVELFFGDNKIDESVGFFFGKRVRTFIVGMELLEKFILSIDTKNGSLLIAR